MVTLYVGGKPVGTLADLDKLLPEFVAQHSRVEFRDEAGNSLGTFSPHRTPTPGEPLVPWDPTITQEELDRRAAGQFITFDELKKRLGWE